MGQLRTWAPDAQVALLFVILFGTLMLVSVVGLLLSLREQPVGSDATRDRFKRDGTLSAPCSSAKAASRARCARQV